MDFYTAVLFLCLVMNVNAQDFQVAKSGRDIILTCPNKYNQPYCQWQRESSSSPYQFEYLAKGNKYLNQDKAGMTIKQFSYVDGGRYRCICYNSGKRNIQRYSITVDYTKPNVIIPRPTYAVAIGENFNLVCTVGQTLPETTELWWTKLNSGNYVNVSGSDVNKYEGGTIKSPILKIINVTSRDSGEYRCNGHNINGDTFVDTQILTGYKPLPPDIDKYTFTVQTGSKLTLICIPHASKSNLTSIWWESKSIHNRQFNTIHNRTSGYSGGYLSIPNLTITRVDPFHEKEYRCNVANIFGTSYADMKVQIRIPIIVTVPKKTYYPIRGKMIKLDCKFSNADKLWWKRVNEGQESPSKISGESTNSLTIQSVQEQDDGEYRCYGSNNFDRKYGTITISSWYIPLVTTPSKSVEVHEGNDTVLSCLHDSNPTPTHVYWTRNGVNISAYSTMKYNGSTIEFPSLVIHDTGKSDSGTYICSVSNDLGTGYSKPLQLLIIEPAKQTSQAGAVPEILVAIVIVVIVVVFVVGVIIWRRRKQKPGATKRSTVNVSMHRERGDSAIGLHFNSRPMSSVAADDSHLSTRPIVAADAEYHNVSDVTSTCIRVEDLKTYIQKRQRHEELKKEYKNIPNIAEHPTTHAETKDNMPKNRFKTTFPYDHTRVILKSDGGSDYINANYIDGFEKERCYIASQGPVKNTVADHWKMIWQENIHQIVMVTNLVEGIKTKCEQYWPSGGKQMVLGNLIIRLNAEKERTAYVTREISIEDKKSGKKRNVTQYHFTAWPDHGTPDPLYLVLFQRHVISDLKAGHSGPLLVHCSAGIGRTGTYIALDALLEEGRTTGFLDIFKFLKKMRYSRMNMIQTTNQYVCLHYALLEAFTMKDTKIRKDEFSEAWQSIRTDHKALNHQRLNKEFKELEQHVGETKGLSPSMLNATKDDQYHNQYNAAMSTTNLAKNRNKDVLPMDDKRVYLVSYGKGRSDYINAVQVPSYTKFVGYITTQLPLPDTKVDFWTMIRDHSSSSIVLIINKANEADLVYSQSGDDLTIGPFGIKISARKKGENDITKITMVLSRKDDKPKQVVLFQAICNNIPDPAVLGKLADLISTRANMSNDPITVVSSDGAKNCGLFCAFTNAVSSMHIDNHADIFQLVRLLQLRRPEFFTDFEEYKRCYEALHVHLESANVYANF